MLRRSGHELHPLIGASVLAATVFAAQALAQTVSSPADAPAADPLWSRRAATPRPQGFRAPGELPKWGVPPGHGAGATGFVSMKPKGARKGAHGLRSGRVKMLWVQPSAAPAAPRAQPQRGRTAIPEQNGLAAPISPRRSPPRIEDDPFAPPGISAGAFLLKPAIEIKGGYDSNPGRTANARGSALWLFAPELDLRSNWQRHELTAELRGALTNYDALSNVNSRDFSARLAGRVDISNQTRLDLETRAQLATASPGTPDLPADLAKLPLRSDVGASLSLAHRFNRFELALKGAYEHIAWNDSKLTNGMTASNRDRNYDQYGAQLRGSYELTPGVKPFVEAGADARVHELVVDFAGVARDSVGFVARAGTTFEMTRKLTGEVSVGYLDRVYKDATLPELRGAIAEASLVWSATPLTTLRLIGKSSAEETILPGVSGTLVRDARVEVEHAFRRWLIGTLKFGIGSDSYVGSARVDHRYVASAAITYKLSRVAQIKGEARREWRTSNVIGGDYAANVFLAGIRLQR